MPIPSLILLYGQDRRLVQTRQWVLESSGFRALTARSIDALEQVAAHEPIDLFLLCDSLPPQARTAALTLIESRWPSARRLVLAPIVFNDELPYDPEVFYAAEGPQKLLATLHSLLASPPSSNERASANLHSH